MNVMDVSDVQRRLRRGKSPDQVSSIVGELLDQLGVTIFSFSYYGHHPHASQALRYDYTSAELASWHQHFNENQYDRIDTTISEVYQSTVPVYWNLEQQLAAAKTEKERKMRLDGQQLGVVDGFSIPIHGPHDDFASLTIQRHQRQMETLALKQHQYTFLAIAHEYYQRIQQCLLKDISADPAKNLTKREMQCLQLVAQEYSVAQIAKTLSLTERTVNFHIQNCNKKLGTKNKHASVRRVFG